MAVRSRPMMCVGMDDVRAVPSSAHVRHPINVMMSVHVIRSPVDVVIRCVQMDRHVMMATYAQCEMHVTEGNASVLRCHVSRVISVMVWVHVIPRPVYARILLDRMARRVTMAIGARPVIDVCRVYAEARRVSHVRRRISANCRVGVIRRPVCVRLSSNRIEHRVMMDRPPPRVRCA